MKPWRYMNHSCSPTAELQFGEDTALLIAARDLRPLTEITIDYNKLLEDVGSPFRCRCPRCIAERASEKIGS
jgi:SET domain-containing protein